MSETKLTRKKADPNLVAKATGQAPPAPPAPAPRPNVRTTGQPLLPPGQMLQGRMTPQEAAAAEAVGFQGELPPGSNKIFQEALAREQALRYGETVSLPAPVAPNTPPLQVTVKALEELSPEVREATRKQLERAAQDLKAMKAAAPGSPAIAASPSVQAAMRLAQDDLIVDDVSAATPPPPKPAAAPAAAPAASPPPPPPAPAAAPQPAAEPDAGAKVAHTHCPQCGHDQSVPVDVEPSYGDKIAYLQTFCGQKPFLKEYPLFGGRVVVCFRTLMTAELELIYQQVSKDVMAGKIDPGSSWAAVNRLRLVASLVSLRSDALEGFNFDFPTGLSKETNPNAERHYSAEEQELGGDTILALVEEHVTSTALQNETVFRVVQDAAATFNRLVIKMEKAAPNPDFWPPIGEQR